MKQNFIELITVPFNAGESKLFAISGQYFELIDATNPIDVLLSDVNGAQRGVMRSAEASFNLKDTDFATVQLYSATAQTIRFAYGTGEAGTRRAAGAVSIVGTVPVTVSNQQTLDAATVDNIKRPILPSASWRDASTIVGNTPLTIFAPGANTNGAVIISMDAYDFNSLNSVQAFVAKSSPPVGVNDGEVIAQSHMSAAFSANFFLRIGREVPTRIGPGLGLYFIGSTSGTAGYFRSCRYVLL